MESIGRRIEKTSGRRITGIHGERRPSLGIVTQVPIKLEEIVVAVDMEVIDAAGYALILGTDWLRKAHAIIDYQECKLILKDEKRTAQISCRNTRATVLDNDKDDDDSEEEYEESSDDSDTDEEEVNFAGLTYELPHQESYMKYKLTSEGMRKNSKLVTWELYDQLSYCFDPVRRKKGAHERCKATGPNSYCWCSKYLETSQDICEVCEEYQQDQKIISIIPRKEIQDIRCNLVRGGVEKLEGNQYKPQVREIIKEFPNLVAKDLSELGKTNLYQHTIDTGGAKPIKLNPYRTSPRYLEFLKEEIANMLKNGLIRKSFSPWSAPIVVVNKKNEKFRL